MKMYAILIMVAVFLLTAETLFQVKDSQDRVVLDVSSDGLEGISRRRYSYGH